MKIKCYGWPHLPRPVVNQKMELSFFGTNVRRHVYIAVVQSVTAGENPDVDFKIIECYLTPPSRAVNEIDISSLKREI